MEERNRIERPEYLQTLKQYRDMPLVKILAGIRRCGKSTILEMFKEELPGAEFRRIISLACVIPRKSWKRA